MDSATNYPHLVSLALLVAASTGFAKVIAEKRRRRIGVPPRLQLWEIPVIITFPPIGIAIMLIYCFVCFLLPALVVSAVLWPIFHLEEPVPDVGTMETLVQLATLFSVGANFADIASTYGRTSFWKHIREYFVVVVPGYFLTMGLAWLGAQGLARMFHYQPSQVARAWRLFSLPSFSREPAWNLVVVASLLLAGGAISHLLRKRDESRGEAYSEQDSAAGAVLPPNSTANDDRPVVGRIHKVQPIHFVIPLLCVAVGLLFLRAGIPLAESIIRMDWPTVSGTILASTVEAGPYERSMYVRLSYEYSVEDKKYVGRYIHNPKDRLFTKEEAEVSIKTKYASNIQVKVYYNRHHPEVAFLEPEPDVGEIFAFCLGLFLFAGGCHIAYGAIKGTIDDVDHTYKEPVTVRERILEAISVEAESPREALKLYGQAKKQSEEFSVFIFVVSFAAPILASVLAFHSSLISGRFTRVVLEFVILAYVGFGVPIMLRAFRDRRNGVVSLFAPEDSRWFWINVAVGGPFFLIRGAWLIVTAILFSLLVLLPFVVVLVFDARDGVINNPALTIGGYLFFPVFCIILLFLWADIRLDDLMPPRNIVNILFAAIRRNILEILENLSAIAAGCVIVSLQSNYATDILTPAGSAMIEGLLSGLFLAFALSRGDLSTDVNVFISLGMSRCHMHLQNWGSARILLRPVDADDICECVVPEDSKKLCEWLSGHLWSVIEGVRLRYQPRDLDRCIDRAKEIVESDVSDKKIWIKNIEANRLLVHGDVVRAALDRATKRRRWVKPIVLSPFWENVLGKLVAMLFWVVVIIFFLRWLFRRLW